MNATEIHDWQFGRLVSDGGSGWCAEEVEWTPGRVIGLCMRTGLNSANAIPENARTTFNALRERQNEFLFLAARDLLDTYNNIWRDDDLGDRPDGWPFDVPAFVDRIEVGYAVIDDADAESELQCSTDGGPLLRVFISPNLSFKEALFD